jgi:hypothetical protein
MRLASECAFDFDKLIKFRHGRGTRPILQAGRLRYTLKAVSKIYNKIQINFHACKQLNSKLAHQVKAGNSLKSVVSELPK